ncbi:hypothetical protein AYJ00_02620 [Shewanella algae]|nr:hypothetical protein AYJ00_02620 [Shewanella algae]
MPLSVWWLPELKHCARFIIAPSVLPSSFITAEKFTGNVSGRLVVQISVPNMGLLCESLKLCLINTDMPI